jgi:outer membrane protein assembly factor BamB
VRRLRFGFVRLLAVLILTATLVGAASCTASTVNSSGVPPEVKQYMKDWPLPNRDYANTRATLDSSINSGNVNTLGVAWSVPIPGVGLFGSASTTPIIMGNTVFFQDLGNNIFALDLTTGATKWQKLYNESNVGPNGVAIGWGKVFATADPYNIAALDMNSGKQLWLSPVSNNPTAGTDIQPQVYGNLVYTSTVPGSSGSDFYSGGGIGTIYALDQATGKIAWSWDTVDSKDIWGNKDVNSGGGCWYTPSIDTATGIMYWGIANPAPWPGTKDFPNGSSRPGPNLYTNSMVAINQKDGKLQWYTQVYPHDLFDYDFQIAPILASATVGGKIQDIVISAGKMGRVYAFNRKSGAILWSAVVGDHQNDQLANIPSEGTTVVSPGSLGGVETPMAFAGGIVYVPVVNTSAEYTPSTSKLGNFAKGTGDLVAIQVDTGKILWQKHFNSINVGGATVVNDLVFTATFDGMVYAFKRNTGEQVWTYQSPGGVNAWPSFSGDTMLLPIGVGGFPSLLALRLGATAPVLAMTPGNGASVTSGAVKVSVQALNFKLIDKLGQTTVNGEGHIHFFMDADAPTTPDKPAVTAAGTYAATANATYTWANVTPGTHTFSAELVNNNHTPLVPPVIVKATITVKEPAPAISITTPANRSTMAAGNVAVSVKVSNFNLVNKLGTTNVAGEGHVHYFLDVVAPTEQGKPAVTAAGTYAATADTTYTWTNVKPGTHTLSVELVNNNHTPLVPPVVTRVVIVVSTSAAGGP